MLREALNVAAQLSNTLRVMIADATEVRSEVPGSLTPEKESNGIQLASAIADALTPDISAHLAAIVENALDPHAIYSRGVSNLRHAECFAVRTGVSGMLDLARSTYLASLEAMEAEVVSLSEKVGRQVRLVSSASRGHYLSLQARPEQLPLEFIQVIMNVPQLAAIIAYRKKNLL
jgi:DNA mismatch repair protein MSH4